MASEFLSEEFQHWLALFSSNLPFSSQHPLLMVRCPILLTSWYVEWKPMGNLRRCKHSVIRIFHWGRMMLAVSEFTVKAYMAVVCI